MSTDQLTTAAMALPLAERVQLAQALWLSIDNGLAEASEAGAVEESARRAEELDRGAVQGKPHEEAMRDLRRSL
jgi:putative addiction module component (TIGR02574 family)